MQHSLLKISIISFLSINSLSFAMETTEAFGIQKFAEDIRRHIFVVAHPSIQNQLKKCCRSWHSIGAKKAPNMYHLVNNPSFNPHQDERLYVFENHIVIFAKIKESLKREGARLCLLYLLFLPA